MFRTKATRTKENTYELILDVVDDTEVEVVLVDDAELVLEVVLNPISHLSQLCLMHSEHRLLEIIASTYEVDDLDDVEVVDDFEVVVVDVCEDVLVLDVL